MKCCCFVENTMDDDIETVAQSDSSTAIRTRSLAPDHVYSRAPSKYLSVVMLTKKKVLCIKEVKHVSVLLRVKGQWVCDAHMEQCDAHDVTRRQVLWGQAVQKIVVEVNSLVDYM